MGLRVVIADDNFLVRAGVAALLAEVDGIDIVDAVADADALLKSVATHDPDAVLTDIRMPPTHSDEGIKAALRIRRLHPDVGVVVLSQYVEEDFAFDLLADGAVGVGYLLKERVSDVEALVHALREVARGGSVLDPLVVEALLARKSSDGPLLGLTEREREVLQVMATGRSNAAIARMLFMSDRAVEKHIGSVSRSWGWPKRRTPTGASWPSSRFCRPGAQGAERTPPRRVAPPEAIGPLLGLSDRATLGYMRKGRALGLRQPAALHRMIVMVGLAGFVVGVYVVVVLGVGAVLSGTDSAGMPLSVVATTIVALLFARVQVALERLASKLRPGMVPTPYEVLSRFSRGTSLGAETGDLPSRMCKLLAEGTGAQWAQVWLSVSGRLTLAATWPGDVVADRRPPQPQANARETAGQGRRALTVRHGGELLGVLRLQERPGVALTPAEERLFNALAAQAGLLLRLVRVRAELEARRRDLVASEDELMASRQRVIQAQDAERRRLERDLHDGAQQHLVALSVNLRLAQTVGLGSPERAVRILAQQSDAALVAIDTLVSLSRGVYPAALSTQGLMPALRSALSSSALPVTFTDDLRPQPDGRPRRWSNRHCTSAAWRPCRMPPSTRALTRSRCVWTWRPTPGASRFPTAARASTRPVPQPAGPASATCGTDSMPSAAPSSSRPSPAPGRR